MSLLDKVKTGWVSDIRNIWRWWSVRLQAVCAFLTGWLFFDPGAMLYAFNLLPGHVRAALPPSVAQAISVIGGFIFILQIMAITARGRTQPKLHKDKTDGPA